MQRVSEIRSPTTAQNKLTVFSSRSQYYHIDAVAPDIPFCQKKPHQAKQAVATVIVAAAAAAATVAVLVALLYILAVSKINKKLRERETNFSPLNIQIGGL